MLAALLLALPLAAGLGRQQQAAADVDFDVVVYGSTPAGIEARLGSWG